MDEAFFIPHSSAPDESCFVATLHTRGPWNALHQHGGPPSALMVRAAERIINAETEGRQLARATIEFYKPVPIAKLRVAAAITNAGRKVARVRAQLFAAETDALIADAAMIFIREAEVAGVAPPPKEDALGTPETSVLWTLPFVPHSHTVGYHTAIEARVARGAYGTGHMTGWIRARVPLIAGEVLGGAQLALLFADAAHGLSAPMDLRAYTFINPELTVYLHRRPEGEWLCLDARTVAEPNGIGMASCGIADRGGPVGTATLSLVIDRRA